MGLTSKKVLLLAVLVAVLLFAVTVWLWPRLAGRQLRTVLGRVAVLLATQLSLFCAAGLFLNYAFGFYASWADLFGQDQSQGVVVSHSADAGKRDGARVVVLADEHVAVPGAANPSIGGRIQQVQITGEHSHISSTAYIYLPPQYFQARYAHRTFPTAVVLTGYPGTAQKLITGLRYPQTAHRLAADGEMKPMVLVMMRPTLAPPRDTECMDVPRGPQVETFLTRDLPGQLTARYRLPRHGGWGIIGDSTGGYCALKLAMRHPGVYSAAVSLSGYYAAPTDPTTGDLFGGSAKLKEESDLFWRLRHLPYPPVHLLVTSSRQGEYNYKATRKFIAMARDASPLRISSITLPSGGHNFNTWLREIPPALKWLSNCLD
jgi:S-formylglutathione hydrolase FrmB